MSAPYFEECSTLNIPSDLKHAINLLEQFTGETADLNIININIGSTCCAVISVEGMASSQLMAELVFQPLTDFAKEDNTDADSVWKFLTEESLMTSDRQIVTEYGKLLELLFSGFAAVITDGIGKACVLGIQGFEKRAVSLPESEQTVGGAHDSFNEALRVNMSLVRRRLKTPSLRFQLLQVGKLSRTDVCLAYIEGRADPQILDTTKQKLMSIELDTVFSSGYIIPFVDDSYDRSIFSAAMTTERPDNACAALNEGRILIMIDGTPGCVVLPTLFSDNFRTMDDYCEKTFYTAFSRIIKYFSFILAIGLPGLYAALVMFHPEVFPLKLLLNLAAAEEATPYPPVVEMTVLILLFEIMREAGVRLPKAVGGAVSIVGGLIIGDAAVKSGMISQPLLIVVGITATASFVLPSLYPAISVLRIVFILAGGLGGLYGIAIAALILAADINAVDQYEISYTSPLSPLREHGLRDVFARSSFGELAKRRTSLP